MEAERLLYAVCKVGDLAQRPCVGHVLARLDEDGKVQPWPIFVVRSGGSFLAYVNRCPHQGSRLDFEPKQFLDPTHRFLMCGKHGSEFDIATGRCLKGPCQGEQLEGIEVVVDGDDICVIGVQLAEEDGLDLAEPDQMPEILIQSD
jgi:nitrite reductase/ring-hydroxylating ferredoxin subunit